MKQQPPNKTLGVLRLIAALLFIVVVQLGILTALQVNEVAQRNIPSTSTPFLFEWEIERTGTAAYEARFNADNTAQWATYAPFVPTVTAKAILTSTARALRTSSP